MKRTIMGTMLILGGMLTAAHADAWVFRDTLRPHGHARSLAAKRADGRKWGTSHNMFEDGGILRTMHARPRLGVRSRHPRSAVRPRAQLRHRRPYPPPIDSSLNDDLVRRQQDQNNIQQMLNQQQMINDQQILT